MPELELDLWASDETRKIQLTPEYWVEIKDELDHGEEQAMTNAAMKGMTRQQMANAIDEGDAQDILLYDGAKLHFLKLAFYLIDWNFKDQQGRSLTLPSRVDDRIKILKRLKPAWGQRISEEIDKVREEKAKAGDDGSLPNAGRSQSSGTGPSTNGSEIHTEAISSSADGWGGTPTH